MVTWAGRLTGRGVGGADACLNQGLGVEVDPPPSALGVRKTPSRCPRLALDSAFLS